SMVETRCPDAHLIILGTGSEEQALAASQTPHLQLLGARDDVADYLRAADVFVLPSEREGLSNALLEAMATGMACVATAVGGTPEVIADDIAGLLVPAGQARVLAEALVRALSDAELRARLGGTAREHVARVYSLDSAASLLRELYDAVTPAPHSKNQAIK